MVKAIIVDLDGTILPNREKHISPENTAALEEAARRGVVRIRATGRSPYSLHRVLPQGLPIDYMVFSSGAGIMRWRDKLVLHKQELSKDDTLRIAGILWRHDVNFTIQGHIPDNHYFVYRQVRRPVEDFRRRVEDYPGFSAPLSSFEEIHDGGTQFLAILEADQLPLFHELREQLSAYSVVRATSPVDKQAIWTEIFAPGVNKGSACQLLLERLGLSFQDCAGLGNDYNDVDFLSRCRFPFVVANAPEDLKRTFPCVAADKDNGLAEFADLALNRLPD